MWIRFLALLIGGSLTVAADAAAQDTDGRVDPEGEAAVDAELGGGRRRAPAPREEPRERGRRRVVSAEPERQPEPNRPRRRKPISLGLLLGYGIDLEENLGVNPWGVGFGARGGYNAGPIFLGGRFVFYLGEDPSNVWEIGFEGGVDFRSGGMTVRPGFGFGLASIVIADDESETDAYLAPGLSLLFDVSRDVFVGVDGRVQFILAEPEAREAIVLLGNAGMRF